MYLLYFVLCDISLILTTLATDDIHLYDIFPQIESERIELHLLPSLSPLERIKRSNTSYAEVNTNVTIVPHTETTYTNESSSSLNVSTVINSTSQNDLDLDQVTNNDNFNIPFPLDITNETLNETLRQQHYYLRFDANHSYYNSTRTDDPETGQHYWVDFTDRSDVVTQLMLSNAYRRANTVSLPFKFQFYGHEIDNVTIATGGFLYTGDYIHSWLAATQYIAPLMANFDTSLSNDSFIKTLYNSTTFTVLWENVLLQDRPSAGYFTFQVSLWKNGDIIFVYKNIPNITHEITEDYHPVKVGLSDAYILDRMFYFIRRKTIFEYHRVHFDKKDLKNWTVIYFKPLPTCLNKTTCDSCLAREPHPMFICQWCDGRCSNGTDRKRHEWLKKDCEKKKINETKYCSLTNEKMPLQSAQQAVDYKELGIRQIKKTKTSASVIFSVILALGCIFSACIWTVYAYRNPHSMSGQILIRYRPSQWSSWRKGEARYTAATIHM
ncbi:hypothetical protein PGB90_003419 [Kerria lacca]